MKIKTGSNDSKFNKNKESDDEEKNLLHSIKDYVMNGKDSSWWLAFTMLTFVAIATRLSYLNYLPGTTWDEVHFGNFANEYINRTFYHDVHPPLGKIFIAAAAYVTGYRGNFNFSEGNLYDDTIRYQLIRSEMALLGALLVPVSFLTVYELSQNLGASTMASLGVLCDTFLHKINSLILLDPILNLAICCSVFCTFKFHNCKNREYSSEWWRWLALTGTCLGIVMSIKYVGVFTVLFVGLNTAYQLYEIACDSKKSIWQLISHTLARCLCLILLPIVIYLGGFILHLTILSETNPDNGAWVHTRFLASLNNTEYDNKTFPKYVNYGANITIQSSTLHVGYLDSWFDLFPSELTAPCQVVSTIPIRDPDGTEWVIKNVDTEKGNVIDPSSPTQAPSPVRNGDWVLLTHLGTMRSLRSHGRRAPFTKRLLQVCGYGDDGVGGPFETWQIIVPGVPIGEPLEVFGHDFMLKNYKMECYLSASDVTLPKAWAHEGAKEVACTRNPKYPTILWHINWINSDKVLGETYVKNHTMGLWERIVQLHRIMFNINAGLKPDVNTDSDDYTSSSPWMWPLIYQMQLLGGFADEPDKPVDKYSVAGFNPMVAYTNIATFGILSLLAIYHFFRVLRVPQERPCDLDRRKKTLRVSFWLILCWGIHYIPFFFMGRTLYIHHYCPSYIYSCLISGVVINHLCEVTAEILSKNGRQIKIKKEHILAIPALTFIASYACFYPLATYIEGEMYSPTGLNFYLDKFYFGQRWLQFGYKMDEAIIVSGARMTSTLIPLEDFENPYLNASLYYETDLNATKPDNVDEGIIRPVAASNFSQTQNWTLMEMSNVVNKLANDIHSDNDTIVTSTISTTTTTTTTSSATTTATTTVATTVSTSDVSASSTVSTIENTASDKKISDDNTSDSKT